MKYLPNLTPLDLCHSRAQWEGCGPIYEWYLVDELQTRMLEHFACGRLNKLLIKQCYSPRQYQDPAHMRAKAT